MPMLRRPDDGSGPGYNPFIESIIKLFPMAVASAVDLVTPGKNPELVEELIALGASKMGLEAAVRFYDRYFNLLMMNQADPDAFTTFMAAGMPDGEAPGAFPVSFKLFQSLVVSSLMTAYHEAVVEVSQLEAVWCKTNIYAAQQLMADRSPNLCPNAVRLTQGTNQSNTSEQTETE